MKQSAWDETETGPGIVGYALLLILSPLVAVGQVLACFLWAIFSRFSPLDQE